MNLKTILSTVKKNKYLATFMFIPKIPIAIALAGYLNSATGCTESSARENPTQKVQTICAEYRGYSFDGDSTNVSYLDSNGKKITLHYNEFADPNDFNVGENYSFQIKEGPILGKRITNIENCVED